MSAQGLKKLKKSTLQRSWFIWAAFLHGMYNWERMQAVGVTHAMNPVIEELYDSKGEVSGALKRHLTFFNTNPQAGSLAAGIMASMEEQRANGMPIDDETINSVKTSLMGPLAGLGDSIMQGMVIPILLAIGISLGLQGSVLGPVIFAVFSVAFAFALSYWLYMEGYARGGALIERLSETGLLKQMSQGATFAGLMAAGGLTARYVNFGVKYNLHISDISTFSLQTQVLDKIMPGLLPVLTVMGIWMLLRKGVKVDRIIWGVFAAGIVLGYFGILG